MAPSYAAPSYDGKRKDAAPSEEETLKNKEGGKETRQEMSPVPTNGKCPCRDSARIKGSVADRAESGGGERGGVSGNSGSPTL